MTIPPSALGSKALEETREIFLSTSGSSVLNSPSDLSQGSPKKDLQEVKSNELAEPFYKAVE